MSDKRYEANIIRTTAVEPANNLESTSAPGVWSLDEVMELQKKNKWPTVGNVITNMEEIFNTYLYTGDSSSGNETTGIDLLNNSGLVWIKWRSGSNGFGHAFYDTVRGNTKQLRADLNAAESTESRFTGFLANGFSLSGDTEIDYAGDKYVAWTFREHAKFMDIVTYTGNGSARTISHNLGSVPGMILVKKRSGTGNWMVYHRKANGGTNPEQYYAKLNDGDAFTTLASAWNNTAPTSSVFSVGDQLNVNENGSTYVAYLFAHNDNDGEFGPNQDQDIIKCGNYTGNGSTIGVFQNIGFEPQWIMFKETTAGSSLTEPWVILDDMRGITGNGGNDPRLAANNANPEYSGTIMEVSATGFTPLTADDKVNGSSKTYIYMALRRGPMATPTDATTLFKTATYTSAGNTNVVNLGFDPDFNINTQGAGTSNASPKYTLTRLMGQKYLQTHNNQLQQGGTQTWWNEGTNFINLSSSWWSGTSDVISWSWKRAPGYFDVCTYTGTGPASGANEQTITHSLGVKPDMIWVKRRDSNGDWWVFTDVIDGTNDYAKLNEQNAFAATSNNVPTATGFNVGGVLNTSSATYIAYTFATLAGISKVGSYTGDNNSTQTIDCGFTSGARFVLLKKSNGADSWYLFDSVQGIVSGNDPFFMLDNNSAQTTNQDLIEPDNSGFIVNNWANGSGTTWFFYAIA